MNHISATVITHNEQDNIERCLNSLSGIADEIIVVDSFSTDATVEICKRYGARISERRFTGYGIQRQYAASLASHSYVLAIDADEVLSAELRASIIKVKKSGFEHRVYSFDVAEYYFGKVVTHAAIDRHPKIRLFNRRYAQWNLHDVGEKVTFSEALRPCLLAGKLLHYRAASEAEFRKKEDLRASLNAAAIAAKNTSISPITPWIKAFSTYCRLMIRRGAILEGHTGRIIARVVARSSKLAYTRAREIISSQAAPHF